MRRASRRLCAAAALTSVALLAGLLPAGADVSYEYDFEFVIPCDTYEESGGYQADFYEEGELDTGYTPDRWRGISWTTAAIDDEENDDCWATEEYVVEVSVWLFPYDQEGEPIGMGSACNADYDADTDGFVDATADCYSNAYWAMKDIMGHRAWFAGDPQDQYNTRWHLAWGDFS